MATWQPWLGWHLEQMRPTFMRNRSTFMTSRSVCMSSRDRKIKRNKIIAFVSERWADISVSLIDDLFVAER